MTPVDAERFWSRVNVDGPVPSYRPDLGPCWIWEGKRDSLGYGRFRTSERGFMAHRVAYEDKSGPIPDSLSLDHLCRVTSCVNPAHLEPVTHQENVRRGISGKRQASRTHCPQGHPYDEANTHRSADGRRHCRKCSAAATRRHYRKRKAMRGLDP